MTRKASSLVASAMVRPSDIGPRIPGLLLRRRHGRIEESLHLEIFRRGQRLGQLDQLGQREAGPRDRHCPGLDAAVAIEPLLQRHLADEVVEADLLLLFHHAVDLDGPRPQLERLGVAGDLLGGAEFVEIIVVGVDLLVRDGPIEHVLLVALDRIEVGGRIGQVGRRAAPGPSGATSDDRGHSGRRQEGAAIEEQVLGGGVTLGNFPSAAANDMHEANPPAPVPCTTRRRGHPQVTDAATAQ